MITGGQALLDTLNGFQELAQTTAERNIVVWVNEYFGRVEAEGKKFSEMAAYHENSEKVCGAVIFAKRNQDTFGRDVEDMIAAKLTFNEAIGAAKPRSWRNNASRSCNGTSSSSSIGCHSEWTPHEQQSI